MEKIEIIGNLGDACSTSKYEEKKFVRFRLAATSVQIENGNRVEKTNWYSVTAYVGAGVIPFLVKGAKVYVRGDLKASIYADKNGYAQLDLSVITSELVLCGSRPIA